MANRFVLKQFAGSATNNGAFGAAQATGAGVQPVANIEDVQSLAAFEQGWNSATLTADKLPPLEEMQGLEALLCKALKENYSEGIPFWIAGETYFQYSFVNYNGIIYYNTTGSYTNNNPAIDTANWAAYNKVGTATVGTDDTPIYLNVGTPTAGKRMGVVAYDSTKTYNLDDVVLNVDSSGAVELYLSLAASNTSALTDTTKWKKVSLGGGADIGDMGFAPLGIDESLNLRRYLNGQVISQDLSPSFTTKVKQAIALFPNLGTTESNWQSEKTLSKLGQCGKFVIDDENQTIRLPAVVNAQGLLSLSGIGNLVNESLPNITGAFSPLTLAAQSSAVGSGALTGSSTGPATYAGSGSNNNCGRAKFVFDASNSSSTYQTDAPVQQEAIQYPYYIQIATGVEETLPAIREYEINTPFFFGQSMYSENAPYNASWLASNGQYNASTLYPDFWVQLTGVELNSSLNVGDTITISGKTYVKRGLPVVLSTGTITDYDFVVNQNDQTFRLPLLNGEEDLRGNVLNALTVPANNTFYTATKNCYLCLRGETTATNSYVYLCILDNGIYKEGYINHCNTGTGNGLNTELFVKRGQSVAVGYSNTNSMYFAEVPAVGNGTLYYYVGDTVQDASLINAGAVLGQLSNKADIDLSNLSNGLANTICTTPATTTSTASSAKPAVVVENYKNGNAWYRVWSDGWIEQGGYVSTTTAASNQTVNLNKAFTTTNFFAVAALAAASTVDLGSFQTDVFAKTTTSFKTVHSASKFWYACGY